MRNANAALFIRLDGLALYFIQPVIAAISLVNLFDADSKFRGLAGPVWTWGSILLLQLIFVDDLWSFASRHVERRRVGVLWLKLLAAGVCTMLNFAGIYRQLGLIDMGKISHDPFTAVYFSITAWSTVGFGDVLPSVGARPFAATQSLIGVLYDSAVIGLVLYASTRSERVDR
jgi:hypothetical protein